MMRRSWASIVILAALIGCGPATPGTNEDDDTPPPTQPTEGDAFLTIEGDTNIFLQNGEHRTLYVIYHSANDTPLAGDIQFRIDDPEAVSTLFESSDVTNPEGLAQVQVIGRDNGEEFFRLIAEAPYATPVFWSIAVSSGDTPQQPLNLIGTYNVDSTFDLVQGIPGTIGVVVNTFIDMTDDPGDPAQWVIDQLINYIAPNYADEIDSIKNFFVSWLNEWLLDNSPAAVGALINLGDDFGQITKRFNVISRLEVRSGLENQLIGKHVVTGFKWKVDGYDYEYGLADMGLTEISVDNIDVTITQTGAVTIADHSLPMQYGVILLFALENIVIPTIDPWASSIEDLLLNMINCVAIGEYLEDQTGFGTAASWEGVCHDGLAALAGWLEDQILSIDGTGVAFNIHGDCRGMDTNGDRTVDRLMSGLWEGTLTLGPLTSNLPKPDQKFNGTRVGSVP